MLYEIFVASLFAFAVTIAVRSTIDVISVRWYYIRHLFNIDN